jgi:replicative DNA helicase
MGEFLTSDFLSEFLKLCFLKSSVIEIAKRFLKYQYIPSELEEVKLIYKSITTYYDVNNKLPSYGYVSQQYSNNIKVQEYLQKIKATKTPNIDQVLLQLEDYIKKVRFQLLYEEVKELYNKDKQDDAIELSAKESEEIVRFNLKMESGRFMKVFEDFEETLKDKQMKSQSGDFDHDKVPTGITLLDEEIHGGIDVTDTMCFLGRSGEGKSTLLKYIGVYACRLGYDVLHIQAEGSKDEAFDKYTQAWSALNYTTIKYGNLNSEMLNRVNKVVQGMKAREKDIYIYAFEMFDEATCVDVRNLILEYEKIKGKFPDLIILDSLDLIHPGDGLKYGVDTNSIKYKKENTSKKIKNMATEFRTRFVTADQADNVPKDQWNDPEFIMTRNNISGAKNLANAFSYFITINRTESEAESEVLRLYFDKLRNYFPQNRILRVATNFAHGRFYDPQETKKMNMGRVSPNGPRVKSLRDD